MNSEQLTSMTSLKKGCILDRLVRKIVIIEVIPRERRRSMNIIANKEPQEEGVGGRKCPKKRKPAGDGGHEKSM